MNPRQAIQRQVNRADSQPFCSTIRISIKVSRMKDSSQRRNDRRFKDQTIEEYEFRMDRILIDNIRKAFREFLAFFYRHRIQICFAGSIIDQSLKLTKTRIERPIFNTFLKNYSWQMLLSIGYRFQQRVTQEFIDVLKTIENEKDFYQVNLMRLTDQIRMTYFRRRSTSGVEQKNIIFSILMKNSRDILVVQKNPRRKNIHSHRMNRSGLVHRKIWRMHHR